MKRSLTTAPKLPPPQKDIDDDWLNDEEHENVYAQSQKLASQRISSSQIVVQQPIQSHRPQSSFIPPQPPLQRSNSLQAPIFKEPPPKVARITGPQSNVRPAFAQNLPRQTAPSNFQRPAFQPFNSRQAGPVSFPRPGPPLLQQRPHIRPLQQQNVLPRPQIIRQPNPPTATKSILPAKKKVTTTSTAVQTIGDYPNQKLGPMKYQMFKGQLDLMWQMRAELKNPTMKIQDAFPKFNTFYDLKDS